MKPLVVVDTMYFAFPLLYKKSPPEHIFSAIKNYVTRLSWVTEADIVFLLEGRNNFRKTIYPEYKMNRKEAEAKKSKAEQEYRKEFFKKLDSLFRVLPMFGRVVQLDSYEADDLASYIAKNFNETYDIYLVSNDSDWFKFINGKNVYIVSERLGRSANRASLETYMDYPIDIKPIADALIGVPKENIKGIKRFGEKTFLKFYQQDPDDFIKAIAEKYDHTDKVSPFTTVQELLEFNLQLTTPVTVLSEEDEVTLKQQFYHSRQPATVDDIFAELLQDDIMLPDLFDCNFKRFYGISD